MDFSRFMDEIVSFAQNHTVIVMVVALGLLFFVYRKPKLFLVFLFIGLFLAGVLYMITSVGGSGSEKKKRLIRGNKVNPIISTNRSMGLPYITFAVPESCTHQTKLFG